MASDFSRIERGLEALGLAATVRGMHPGVDSSVVKDRLSSLGLQSSAALEQWFGWHDGIDGPTLGSIAIYPGFHQRSLDEISADYQALLTDSRWSPGWVPVLADGGGYFYVVDQSQSGNWPLLLFRNDWVEHAVEYANLEAFVATLADAYEEGALRVGASGYLQEDNEKYAAIARRRNPGVAWWN